METNPVLVIGQPRENAPEWTKVTPAADGKPEFKSWSLVAKTLEEMKFGVWEAAPGQWERNIAEPEFCHFVSGRATFTTADGVVHAFKAGDSAYFPRDTRGTWRVEAALRKVFISPPY
jgi:uncharacterized cupin superfamily protein